MGYVEQNLMSGEQILTKAKLHWAVFVNPGIVAGIGLLLVLLSFGADRGTRAGISCFAWVILMLGALYLGGAAASYLTTEFALTNRRVIAKTGMLRRRSLELVVSKIESIAVNQPIMGRVFDYGTVVVVGTGGTREGFPNIANPMDLRKQINAQIAGGSGA